MAYWATVSLGAAVVGMNAWWTSPEMEYGLADSRPEGFDRRRRAPGTGGARSWPGCATTAPLDVISVRSDRELPDDRVGLGAMGRRGAVRWSARDAAGRRHRSRRRRLHLLHVGHDRLPEGRPTDPPRLGAQRDEPVFMGMVASAAEARARSAAGGDAGAAQTVAPPAAGLHGADPAVPRHRVQLPVAPGTLARRLDRAHAQMGPGPRARADRTRARHELLGCADDEPRAAGAPRLEHA